MTEKPTFYITTPIYYPSGRLHIGNSYTTLACDAMARYKRLKGYDVHFLTGTDEHGQKIEKKAAELGMEPQAYVDKMADAIRDLWQLLGISNDQFIRTTDEAHEKAVQLIFQRLLDQGDIYLGEYEGWYSVSDEEYFTETQLSEVFRDESGKVIGGIAPSGHEVELVKEESYFFKLGKYAERLIDYYHSSEDVIIPSFRKNEMINNFIKPGLSDLAVSRTSFSWGVPVKSDPKHVIYVWIDALSNYITALSYPDQENEAFKKYWPADVHMIGKDISRFHMIYWPAILMALDLPLPKHIYAHGWIVMKDGKMSKSKGNVIYPETLIERYGLDAVRYYLLREMSQGNDTVFTPEDFITCINSELANDLGNLLNRTVAMINKYQAGSVKNYFDCVEEDQFEQNLKAFFDKEYSAYLESMEKMAFDQALDHLMAMVSRAKKYIDETQPWILAKEADNKKLPVVLFYLAESLRFIGHLLRPFMINTPKEIFRQLGIEDEVSTDLSDLAFGHFPKASQVVSNGVPIFPRLDVEEEQAYILKEMTGKSNQDQSNSSHKLDDPDWDLESLNLDAPIEFDDFIKTELKVAQVMDVAPVKGSNKLLRFRLDAGESVDRQILSGIAKYYPDHEALIGRKLIIVSNLKPRKMMGYWSQGMILSAESGKDLHLVFAPDESQNGALIG